MRTILLTGGAGFIGGAFVRRFVGESNGIINLDALTYAGNLSSLRSVLNHQNHVFVRGDIRDQSLVPRLFEKYRPDAVVHFAAESHVDRSIGAPATFVETNVLGTQNMLDAARLYWDTLPESSKSEFRFVHVSTDEVYGSLGPTGKFTEQTSYAPNSPYSASKAAADHLARAYYHTYDLPVVITNCSNNYGPFQYPEKLIPLVILNALEGKPLPVYGDGKNVRDWLHVQDHCDALMTVLSDGVPGEVYNIGGNAEHANIDVVRAICDTLDELRPDLPHVPCCQLIEFVTDRPGHDRRYAIDSTKIQRELGWKPRHTFESGIRETVGWYLENQAWAHEVTKNRYNRERLGTPGHSDQPAAPMASTRTAPSYVDGSIDGVIIRELKRFEDQRGWLMEMFRNDELPFEYQPVMGYVSQTSPGVVRGPHEHLEQADYFVFAGPGTFELFLWDSRPDSPSFGKQNRTICGRQNPVSVIVPPGVVHAYKNIGDQPGWVFNAPNRLYAGRGKRQPVDEIRHEDQIDSPYVVD